MRLVVYVHTSSYWKNAKLQLNRSIITGRIWGPLLDTLSCVLSINSILLF